VKSRKGPVLRAEPGGTGGGGAGGTPEEHHRWGIWDKVGWKSGKETKGPENYRWAGETWPWGGQSTLSVTCPSKNF